jgi:glutamine amidotransferase
LSIVVVDYGMGNIRSVSKALERVAPRVRVAVSADPAVIRASQRVVVPGQGAMPDCMRQLADSGARDAVIEAARDKPFLGICVGRTRPKIIGQRHLLIKIPGKRES